MVETTDPTTRRIQLLYELSLCLGRSIDAQEICRGFLETLLARKALCYGAIWIRGDVLPDPGPADARTFLLVHAIPLARVDARRLPLTHPMFHALEGDATCLVRTAAEPDHASLVVERDVEGATIALFRLGELGWLKLIADGSAALGRSEVGPLRTVVAHLANALEGALAYARLRTEVNVRRRAEERLASALAEREAIVAGVPDMLFTAEAEGRLTWRSAPLFEEHEDPEPAFLQEMVVPEDRPLLVDWLERTVAIGRCEVDVYAELAGERRRFHFTGVRLDQGWADAPTVVGSARDVTERERAAEERRDMERRMLHAQKLESLGLLAGGIAHDFNNLLVPIVAHADMARTVPDLPRSVLESLDTIHGAGRRAADLARQMLAYSGRARFRVGRVELTQLIQETSLLLDVAISKKVRLERRLDPDAPPVEGDENQLRQVFMNLVTNASEAIGEASGTITLRTGAYEHRGGPLEGLVEGELHAGRYAFAEVADTGSGMDAETRALIFDPFFTTKFTGRGLGLAAVLGIVRSHGGGIVLASAPGAGSRFRVLVPAAADTADDEERGESAPPARARSAQILLVDDEPLVRATARAILERAGLGVHEVEDGQAAVQAWREVGAGVDLVLMDLTMPRMGGEEAARELHQLAPEVPIVLMSGYDEMELSARPGPDRSYRSLLRKPFLADELLRRVWGALENGGRAERRSPVPQPPASPPR